MQYVLQPQIMDLAEPAVVVRHNEAAVTEQRGVGHDMTQFTFEYELGRGSSGVTYLEIHDGRMVALKVIKDGGDEQSRERTRTEVQVNNIIRNDPHCPNVVRSMECFHFGDATLITMELCCGTLLDVEKGDHEASPERSGVSSFSWSGSPRYQAGKLVCVELYATGGEGRRLRQSMHPPLTMQHLHMSPERVDELEYTANCDSFSLGMCEFIMCGGFGIGFDWEKLKDRKILREKHNEIASGLHSLDGRVSPDCISFMLDAMRERKYPAQLMTHHWLQQ
eukprot:TRINITY_DN3303_c0_g2_i1.p1 TRINITY_DN3303_c0_g2~~TRINITY_DN3303_c0_g2_i1.p1  ORF type:complete len:279 (+),score=31.76 TRINITY_DN3303_c0_g2_i1:176-1012(+)